MRYENSSGVVLETIGYALPGPAIAQSVSGGEVMKRDYEIADIYANLRDQVLRWQPESTDRQSTLIAVLMETGYPEAVATLVVVSEGAVSLYFSNGGGIIGAGEHDAVRRVAQTFLSSAEGYVSQASRTESFPLPARGNVRFYFITTPGTYTVEVLEEDLGYERHSFSPLFHLGHELITVIRAHTPE
jgi:hypothetical protein